MGLRQLDALPSAALTKRLPETVTVRSDRGGPNWGRQKSPAVAANGAAARVHLTRGLLIPRLGRTDTRYQPQTGTRLRPLRRDWKRTLNRWNPGHDPGMRVFVQTGRGSGRTAARSAREDGKFLHTSTRCPRPSLRISTARPNKYECAAAREHLEGLLHGQTERLPRLRGTGNHSGRPWSRSGRCDVRRVRMAHEAVYQFPSSGSPRPPGMLTGTVTALPISRVAGVMTARSSDRQRNRNAL